MRWPTIAALLPLLAGCPSDPAATDTDAADTGATGTGANTGPVTTAAGTNADDDGLDATAGDTTAGNPSGTDTAADSTAADEGPLPPDPFVFDDTPIEQYVQQDRAGLAGFSTLLVLIGDKDAHNASTPALDITAPTTVDDAIDSLVTLHRGVPNMQTADNTGLDDDLQPEYAVCSVSLGAPFNCFDQVNPVIFPDVLKLVVESTAGFPNGRRLDTPVMDLMLALVLLDLQTLPPDLFVDMDEDGMPGPSLNPIANDVAFSPFFPHLAPPHR